MYFKDYYHTSVLGKNIKLNTFFVKINKTTLLQIIFFSPY